MTKERRYGFSWDLIGDVAQGRPNLGNTTRVELYRLMEYTFRDRMEMALGTEKTDELFYEAGRLAGSMFAVHMLKPDEGLNGYIRQIQTIFRDLKIGILRVEETSGDGSRIVVTVGEDLDCSGLPDHGEEICVYDEGFLCGMLEYITGDNWRVEETDCWCTGDRVCRFEAHRVSGHE